MRTYIGLFITAAILFFITACGTRISTDGDVLELSMATGGVAGVYYPYGNVIASLVSANIDHINISGVITGASVANANALRNGDVELALMQNDILYYAFTAREVMSGTSPMPELRTIATLYPEAVQLVASAESGIRTVADLAGKRVVVGARGSGTEANAMHILAAHGLQLSDLGAVEYMAFGDASAALQNGEIDAAFATAGAPMPALVTLSSRMDIVLVPIEGDAVAGMMAQFPFYTMYTIDGKVYGLPDVTTVAVRAALVTTNALCEDTVYAITQALFENQLDMAIGHARGSELSPRNALLGVSVPLHPGAKRFYIDEGLGHLVD
jgi:hypothetical protein